MLALIFTTLLTQVASAAPTQEYLFLKDRRAEFSKAMPTYSAEEKQVVADQAMLLIRDLYVHRELKTETFHEDPIPALEAIQKNATSLTDFELHSQLLRVFQNQRDFHTMYYLPKPYSCYRTFIPFSFDRVWDSVTRKHVIVVQDIGGADAVMAMLPDVAKVQIGDIIESYNGVDPVEAIRRIKSIDLGANEAAQIRAGIDILTIRFHDETIEDPIEDSVRMILRKKSGKRVTVTIPWVSYAVQSCITTEAKTPEAESAHQARKNRNTNALNRHRWELNHLIPLHQRKFKRLDPDFLKSRALPSQDQKADLSNLTNTTESTIRYKVLQTAQGSFGYLQITSFDPENLSKDESVALVRNILSEPFANTSGLILDLRGNPGGQVDYAERLLQLFSSKVVETEGFRLLTTETNHTFLSGAQYDDFLTAWTKASSEGHSMTAPLKITPRDQANSIGQFYFKPTMVLVNAYCFSSCDIFTAGMQDNQVAKVWGVDGRTGGGGANVMTLSDFINGMPADQNSPFKAVPADQQTMQIAWRQSVRVGIHRGELLEDKGVTPDWISTPGLDDLVMNDQLLVNRMIHQLLSIKSAPNAYADIPNPVRQDFVLGKDTAISIYLAGTSKVDLRSNEKTLLSWAVDTAGPDVKQVNLGLPAETQKFIQSSGSLELIGYNQQGRAWRKTVDYRIVPENSTAIPLDLNFGSTTDTSPLSLYTTGDARDGWNIKDGALQVGSDSLYPNMTHTEASLFLDLSKLPNPQLTFDAEIHTEQDSDFFKAVVIFQGTEVPTFVRLSGDVAKQTYTIDLTEFHGQNVEIRFVFDSDQYIHFSGPRISRITVK